MYDFVVEAGSVIQYTPFFLLAGLYPMFVSLFAQFLVVLVFCLVLRTVFNVFELVDTETRH